MKKFNTLLKIFIASLAVFVFVSCEIDSFAEDDEYSFGDITAPTNVQISARATPEAVGGPGSLPARLQYGGPSGIC